MRLLISIFFFISCTIGQNESPKKQIELIWDVIENASINRWSRDKLIKAIGWPNQTFKSPNKYIPLAWAYKNDKSGFQEWGISFNDNGTIKSVTYLPQGSYHDEFTIEKIIKRWKSLNCEYKTRKITKPHVIKEEKYISCDNEKKIVKYNKYKEVESISVRR